MADAPTHPVALSWRTTIRRLVRSSSFRLMLIYAGLFTLSVLVLFVIIGISTDGFMTRQIDAIVANELAEIRADAGDTDPARFRAVVDELSRHSPGFYYLLEDPSGHVLAGNMTAMHPKVGLRSLSWSHRAPRAASDVAVRGRGELLPDGSYLFVGSSAASREEMRLSLLKAFLWSLGVIVVLGLGGGLLMSMLVLRRIEAISLATRAIMSGDLSQRIPLDGSGDEFDHLSGSLNAMLERIEALLTGMRQISNDIAHDLRTPLTRLRQRLELARRRDGPVEALHDQLDAATAQVDVILATFTSLLRIAQIEARAEGEGFVDIALQPLVDTLLDAYGPVAEERCQVMSADVPPDLVVRGEKALLNQLLANLLENALRHTPEGSRVAVTGKRGPDGIMLSIADDGPGIAVDQHEFVLRRFARLDVSRNSPGSGLGLSMAKAVAELHGAAFTLEDNRPGLTCVLVFPISGPRARKDSRSRFG